MSGLPGPAGAPGTPGAAPARKRVQVATKPYEFIGFGAMDVTKPHEFIGLGPCLGVGVFTVSNRARVHDKLLLALPYKPGHTLL